MNIRKITKDFYIYSLGKIVAASSAFFLLPLYTRYLTKEQLGQLELAITAIFFISILMSMGLPQIVGVEYARCSSHDAVQRIKQISNQYLLLASMVLVIVTLIYFLIGQNIFDFLTFAVIILIASLMFYKTVYLTILQHSFRPLKLNILETLSGFLVVAFGVIIIVYYGKYDVSYLLLGYIVSVVFVICVYILTERDQYFKLTWSQVKIVKNDITFSLPLMLTVLSSWILTSSDRWILSYVLNSEAVGIYAVSYKIASIYYLMLITTVGAVISPYIYKSFSENGIEKTLPLIRKMYFVLTGVTVVILLLDFTVGRHIFNIIIGREFSEAFQYIHFLIVSFFLVGLIHYGNYLLIYCKESRLTFIVYAVGALFNVVMNLILIRILGIKGVVISTFLSYLIMFLIIHIFRNRVYSHYLRGEYGFLRQ